MSEPAVSESTDRFCPACGYNLRGIASDRCPECGQVFDPNQPTEPQIPWSHRRTIGRRKAFWRTVKLVCFHNKQFATEINRPVSLADALAFRRAVALHLFIPIALLTAWAYLQGLDYVHGFEINRGWWSSDDPIGSLTQLLGLPVLLVSIWLFLIMTFGIGSYFFHPKSIPVRHQNRAVALSYYGCAPWVYFLIVAPAIAAIAFTMAVLEVADSRRGMPVGMAVGTVLMSGLLLIWITLLWVTPVRMLTRTTHCSGTRTLVFAILQPVLLLVAALLTLGVINGLFWGLAFVALSFT